MNWWTRVMETISPRCCVACGSRLSPTERTLCATCLLHLPRTAFQHAPTDNEVDRLFWHLLPVQRAAALLYYEPHSAMAQAVYRMKYDRRPDTGVDMGRIMAEEMRQAGFFDGIDLLLPVPLTDRRQRQRGYNQSERLAQGIHDVTGIPVVTTAVTRESFHRSQTQLTRRERRENVEGAFVLRQPERLAGRHVLLVDDICTTGATLIACGNAIRGVKGIKMSVLTLGYTKK